MSDEFFTHLGYLKICYGVLIFIVCIQRLIELRISRKNERQLLELGAVELAPKHFLVMKIHHVLWLGACLYFGMQIQNVPIWPIIIFSVLFFLFGQILRIWAIKTLGYRWSVRIFILPKLPVITSGPYRFIRHPNYLGVILEIAALPLIMGMYEVALASTLTYGIILLIRIRAEERGLQESGTKGASKNRFIPNLF